jgi:hypothetical protein
VVNAAPILVPCVRYLMVFLLQWWGKVGRGKLSCCTKMLDPKTETKRGNFGRYYPWSRALVLHSWVGHGTMGLKCVPLYYTSGLVMGPWVWSVCPCTTGGLGMGPWVWSVYPCTTRVGWEWDNGFEMCVLVLHACVGHGPGNVWIYLLYCYEGRRYQL